MSDKYDDCETEQERYVRATMALEGMELTPEEIQRVRDLLSKKITIDEAIEELNRKYKK